MKWHRIPYYYTIFATFFCFGCLLGSSMREGMKSVILNFICFAVSLFSMLVIKELKSD